MTGRVGSGGFQTSRVGSGQEIFESHGSGRVNSFSDLAGRVGSGQEAGKISRVGMGQANTPRHFRGSVHPTRLDPTHEV